MQLLNQCQKQQSKQNEGINNQKASKNYNNMKINQLNIGSIEKNGNLELQIKQDDLYQNQDYQRDLENQLQKINSNISGQTIGFPLQNFYFPAPPNFNFYLLFQQEYMQQLKIAQNQKTIEQQEQTILQNNEILQNQREKAGQLIPDKLKNNNQIQTQNDELLIKLEYNFQRGEDINQQHIKKQRNFKQVTPKSWKSLLIRNMKLNFGSGIQYLIEMIVEKANLDAEQQKLDFLKNFLVFIDQNHYNLRSFIGWKIIFSNKTYGKFFRKIALKFFRSSCVLTYIMNSKIKSSYKPFYLSKVHHFIEGIIKPKKFSSFNFQ